MNTQTHPVIPALQKELIATRKQILDLLEMAFRDHPNWSFARSRVLRALGKSGLEGVLDQYLGPDSRPRSE